MSQIKEPTMPKIMKTHKMQMQKQMDAQIEDESWPATLLQLQYFISDQQNKKLPVVSKP